MEQTNLQKANILEVVIIGSGPAGLTAALYAARAELKPLVIDGVQPGGQLTITTEVENYPGFPKGVQGPELMELFRDQALRFGTQTMQGTVTEVRPQDDRFVVVVDGQEISARSVIISSGASAKLIGLENELKYMGKGVSACATCDGFFFRNKRIFVVGGGDTAMEEALFLTKFASQVTVIHRRDELRASKFMQKRAFDNPKVDFLWDSVVVDVLGDNSGMTAIRVRNVKDESEQDITADGLFVAIGHKPNTEVFEGLLDMDPNGYLITKPGSTHTSVPGIFACGDVQDFKYRQAVTAAGSGCMAAIDAEHWLEEQKAASSGA